MCRHLDATKLSVIPGQQTTNIVAEQGLRPRGKHTLHTIVGPRQAAGTLSLIPDILVSNDVVIMALKERHSCNVSNSPHKKVRPGLWLTAPLSICLSIYLFIYVAAIETVFYIIIIIFGVRLVLLL